MSKSGDKPRAHSGSWKDKNGNMSVDLNPYVTVGLSSIEHNAVVVKMGS